LTVERRGATLFASAANFWCFSPTRFQQQARRI
jgi:hypothetical protein